MKIITTCGQLRSALQKVKAAIRGNKDGVATIAVRAGQVELQMSGGGTTSKTTFKIDGGSNASIVLNGVRAMNVLATASASSALELSITEKEMRMKFESANIRIPVIDSITDLLTEATWNTSTEIVHSIKGALLKAQLTKVLYAAARSDVRHYLNCVNFCEIDGCLAMVATNGHMLAASRGDAKIPTGTTLLVPIEIAEVLSGLIEDDDDIQMLQIGATDDQSGFGIRTDSFELKTPLACGKFPDWRKVMPDRGTRHVISMNAKQLAVAIERVRLASMDTNLEKVGVRLSITPEGIRLNDSGGESFDLVKADTGVIGDSGWDASFNPDYLLSSIKHVDGNISLFVDAKAGQAPLLLSEDDKESWGGLVMPLRT